MRLPAWEVRRFEICQHYGLPVPWMPREVADRMLPDRASEAEYGRVWCTELDDTYEEELEVALAVLDVEPANASLAAFGVSLPRRGRGRPQMEYLVSGPTLHLELRVSLRERPAELSVLRRSLLNASSFARTEWGIEGTREALVLLPDGAFRGPLPQGVPSTEWLDDHEIDRSVWLADVAGQ